MLPLKILKNAGITDLLHSNRRKVSRKKQKIRQMKLKICKKRSTWTNRQAKHLR